MNNFNVSDHGHTKSNGTKSIGGNDAKMTLEDSQVFSNFNFNHSHNQSVAGVDEKI